MIVDKNFKIVVLHHIVLLQEFNERISKNFFVEGMC